METKPKSILSLLCLLALTSFFTGCGETVISEDQMQTRNGLVYTVNQESPFTGVVVKRYEDGEGWDRRYRDGIRHGRWTKWFPNGIKSEEFSYKEGELDGKSTEWFENGTKSEEFSYKEGGLDGKSTEWHRNGQKRSEGSYRNGKKNGKWTEWFKNGQRSSVGSYKDGDRDGEWISWYENGQKQYRINYIKGTKDGAFTLWYENGTTYVNGAYKVGVENGEWTVWSNSGSKNAEWTTSDGSPIDGKLYAWHADFESRQYPVSPRLEVEYENGLRSGSYIQRVQTHVFPHSVRIEGSFSFGMAHGEWIVYTGIDDQKVIEAQYKDGKRDGVLKISGHDSVEITYVEGVQVSVYMNGVRPNFSSTGRNIRAEQMNFEIERANMFLP